MVSLTLLCGDTLPRQDTFVQFVSMPAVSVGLTPDPREYDTAGLILETNRLRRTYISVKGFVTCFATYKCVLLPPWPMQDWIGIGLDGLSSDLQKNIIFATPNEACPERLTGFFDGVQLEVSSVEFSSGSGCTVGTFRDAEKRSFPIDVGSSPTL
jgi:hypothetical protein